MRLFNDEWLMFLLTVILASVGTRCRLRGKSVRSWCDGSLDRSFVVVSLSYFSFQPVLHDRCNKGRGMCHPVCGKMHIKEPLLLERGKSSPCGGSGFSLSLSEWSFTICLTPYNRKYNVLSASLNKTFPSFLPSMRGRCEVVIRDRAGHNIY